MCACECAHVNACVHDTKSAFQSTRGGWRTHHTPHCSPHTKASAHRCFRVDSMEGVRSQSLFHVTAEWTGQSATPMMATANPQPHYQHHHQQQHHGRSSRGPRGEGAPRKETIALWLEGRGPKAQIRTEERILRPFQLFARPSISSNCGSQPNTGWLGRAVRDSWCAMQSLTRCRCPRAQRWMRLPLHEGRACLSDSGSRSL
jgi:hypothetical protein